MIAVVNGTYRCYSTENGIRRHYSGCSHEKPRQAIRHTANHPYTSPLRAAGIGPSVTGSPSDETDSSSVVGTGPIPASRKRVRTG